MRVLAVDDEPAALFLLQEAIGKAIPDVQQSGFTLPSEALAYANDHPIDVAFLDQEMPGMDGVTLAQELIRLQPRINIIFTTAYREYGAEAFAMRASGYLLKPIRECDILREIQNLRNPIEGQEKGLRAVTFGHFEFLKDGAPVPFRRSKAKEMLAYLIEKKGAGVSKKELAAVLLEDRSYDRSCQDYMSKIIDSLAEALTAVGAGDVLVHHHNLYAVDPSRFVCDLYAYEKGEVWAINSFHGEYMQQYSWGEYMLGDLVNS